MSIEGGKIFGDTPISILYITMTFWQEIVTYRIMQLGEHHIFQKQSLKKAQLK